MYEVVIGVEVHAQLRTKSKMFCSCSAAFGRSPNSQTCPVYWGSRQPAGHQQSRSRDGCSRRSRLELYDGPQNRFARKKPLYPDLPKGCQISQYEAPVCEHGWIEIAVKDDEARADPPRPFEEDAGKNLHGASSGGSQRLESCRHAIIGNRHRARHAIGRRSRFLFKKSA